MSLCYPAQTENLASRILFCIIGKSFARRMQNEEKSKILHEVSRTFFYVIGNSLARRK